VTGIAELRDLEIAEGMLVFLQAGNSLLQSQNPAILQSVVFTSCNL
jgi:hypothetical protein